LITKKIAFDIVVEKLAKVGGPFIEKMNTNQYSKSFK
jgi:hypothetical protein